MRIPTFPDRCSEESLVIHASVADDLLACLSDDRAVGANVSIDGMSYEAAVRSATGVAYRSAHFDQDPRMAAVVGGLVSVLRGSAGNPICKRGLAGVAGHLGLSDA
jgi:hypothetical protein